VDFKTVKPSRYAIIRDTGIGIEAVSEANQGF